jgi:DNA polymerase-4
MEKLPVNKFFGVGKVTAMKMNKMGIHTGGDLKKFSEEALVERFGKSGRFYFKIVRGIDNREVQPYRETKSIGAEDTFQYDLKELEDMHLELDKIAHTVYDRVTRRGLRARTLTLKIKFHDFKQITRSRSVATGVGNRDFIIQGAKQLLAGVELDGKRVRLLGISLSNFERETNSPASPDQLSLEL